MAKNFFRVNENDLDRFVRASIGVLLVLLGAFLASGWWRVGSLAVAGIVLFTAASGFCGAYVPFGIDTQRVAPKALKRRTRQAWSAALALLLVGGAAGGYFLNSKSFKNDFAALNAAYKNVLYLSGQDSPETAKAQADFEDRLADFGRRQLEYRPWVVRDNAWLRSKTAELAAIAQAAGDEIGRAQNPAAHLELEKARPIIQRIMEAAGLSELAVALIDFHDSMEAVLEAANGKDLAGVIAAYTAADGKLKAVEALAQDDGIVAIRRALDRVLESAAKPEPEALPEAAAKLKAAFVKVYLSRG